jgi:acyl-coenzyme A thioesterase PaaI-like protein
LQAEQVAVHFEHFGTIDMRIDYLHQGLGSSFCATAKVVRLRGRIASVQMELRNDAGLLIATGSEAYVVS